VKLLLARHGNTFEDGVEPYMVGRNEDPPLTAKGEAQAEALAACLQRSGVKPDVVFCGPLKRTRRMASIVASTLALPQPVIAASLTELDYGTWSGLTAGDIKARFGLSEYEAWEHHSIMPANRGWQPDTAQLLQDLYLWIDTLPETGTALAITSNGILRFLPHVLGIPESALPTANLKVKTGHLCGFTRLQGAWNLDFWNADPLKLKQI
jgi:probable phosphoglycerate mutase